MNLFYKEKAKYKIVNLFKIVNIEQAKQFDLKLYTYQCIDYLNNIDVKLNYFNINFDFKAWTTYQGFDKGISKINNEDIVYFFSGNKEKSYVEIDNSLLNLDLPPQIGSIEITVSIKESIFQLDSFSHFLIKSYDVFSFDYGYIVFLDESYDFLTERKLKSTLFGTKNNVKEIDHIWISHCMGVNYGFIKKLYPINFLNETHLAQPLFQTLMNKSGSSYKLNDRITVWLIDDNNLDSFNQDLSEGGYCIGDEKGYQNFLNTKYAKIFYDQMKFK
ncbi:MAG: hypothetical protein NW226_12950 [Microscillaceae bacterium]|nr:hypothetical protein [Microscillaceae bacterium]